MAASMAPPLSYQALAPVSTVDVPEIAPHLISEEGATGYTPSVDIDRKESALLASRLSSSQIQMLRKALDNHRSPHCAHKWSTETLYPLITAFSPTSVHHLGQGQNSTVFVMEGEIPQVLRLFPLYHLKRRDLAKSYVLDRDRIGGEWLSTVVDAPHVASNSHILAWDNQEGFKVLNKEEVKELINDQWRLGAGRKIYALGTVGEYVEGSKDLALIEAEKSSRGERFTPEEIKTILRGILQGAQALHEESICHRDLRDANILMLPFGEVKLIDFGCARLELDRLRMSASGYFYARPIEDYFDSKREKSGKLDDSYRIYLIAYQLLSGKKIFTGKENRSHLMQKHLQKYAIEKRVGLFQSLQWEFPDADPRLIKVMEALGSKQSQRKTPEEVLQMEYFQTF